MPPRGTPNPGAPGPGRTAEGRPARRLLAAYAAVYGVWGSTFLAIRVAVATLPPFGMAAARFLLAGAVLYGWARARGAPAPTRAQWRAAAVVGALFLLLGNGGVTWAEQRVPSGVAALLVATQPLWVALLAWALPRWGGPGGGGPGGAGVGACRPGGVTAAGLGLGLAGVALLVGPAPFGGSRLVVDPRGAAAVVAGALAWAAGTLWPGRARLPASPALAAGMQMLAGGALFAAASAAAGEPAAFRPAAVALASVAALAYLVAFGSVVAFGAFAWLLTVEPPERVATHAFVNPVVAVALGWAAAGEPVGARTLAAAALVVGAVALLVRRPRERPAPAQITLGARHIPVTPPPCRSAPPSPTPTSPPPST